MDQNEVPQEIIVNHMVDTYHMVDTCHMGPVVAGSVGSEILIHTLW